MCKKVLIAEDYEDTRSLMRFILESFGYEVVEATNGVQAVESVRQENPDLVLMDISMPVMDGLTATQIIRKSNKKSDLPIIGVTAFDDYYQREAIEAGCDCLINKPLDFDMLEPFLEEFFADK